MWKRKNIMKISCYQLTNDMAYRRPTGQQWVELSQVITVITAPVHKEASKRIRANRNCWKKDTWRAQCGWLSWFSQPSIGGARFTNGMLVQSSTESTTIKTETNSQKVLFFRWCVAQTPEIRSIRIVIFRLQIKTSVESSSWANRLKQNTVRRRALCSKTWCWLRCCAMHDFCARPIYHVVRHASRREKERISTREDTMLRSNVRRMAHGENRRLWWDSDRMRFRTNVSVAQYIGMWTCTIFAFFRFLMTSSSNICDVIVSNSSLRIKS